MKLTRDQRRANLEVQMDWEEARERGEPFKVEYLSLLTDNDTWEVVRDPAWSNHGLYRRKPEPDKPFRAFVNIYDSDRDGLRQKACHRIATAVSVFRTAHQANEATCANTAETCAILPADELAKLEREHGEMLAVLKAVDEYRHRNIAELETRWDALCDSIEKAIKQCDS
jgi:hypothetical protein